MTIANHVKIRQATWVCLLTAAAIVISPLSQGRVLPEEQGRQLLSMLDNSIWIGDSEPSDRNVYVIFSTACSWCRSLHTDSLERDDGVQLRWLLLEGSGNAPEYVAEQGTLAAIARAFRADTPAPRSRDQALARLNVNAWVRQSLPGVLAFPTFVYQGASGVEVAVGMRSNLSALLARVEPRAGTSAHASASLEMLERGMPALETVSIRQFINFEQQPLPMHSLPSTSTPRVGEVPHMGQYDEILGVVGNEWIAVVGLRLSDGRRVPAYIHAPKAVALTRLVFDIDPASGSVTAEAVARPIHSHPSRSSPVLEHLPPGYGLDRVGKVFLEGEDWDVVAFFRDGGRAYVPTQSDDQE